LETLKFVLPPLAAAYRSLFGWSSLMAADRPRASPDAASWPGATGRSPPAPALASVSNPLDYTVAVGDEPPAEGFSTAQRRLGAGLISTIRRPMSTAAPIATVINALMEASD
jgi:hypothetical protein